MSEPIVIMDNKVCPSCHQSGTVAQKVMQKFKDSGKIPRNVSLSLGRTITPLEEPILAGVTVETLVIYEDICINCGIKYYTRAELVQAPVVAQDLPKKINNRYA